MSSIVFIGFRGSGKSTLGKWLAADLGEQFIDTDDVVLAHLGFSTVSEAWQSVGEVGWREAEELLIPELLEKDAVISLGGGAPMLQQVATALIKSKIVIHLISSEEATLNRIAKGEDRPALSATDLEVRLERLPAYGSLATFTVATSCAIEESKQCILEILDSVDERS